MLAFREQCVSAFTRIGRDELPASAGTGTPLDDTYEREYVFLRNSRSVCRADTIITVTGDSMLPTFRDGDELLVEYTPEIREGEIGFRGRRRGVRQGVSQRRPAFPQSKVQ